MENIISFGEILLRLSTPSQKKIVQSDAFDALYGGSEANVAVSLANLNNKVSFVTCLPQNELGKAAMQSLAKYNVDTNQIVWSGNRLGIYFLENGAGHRNPNVIYDRAGSAIAEVRRGMIPWNELFKSAKWFHWSGITAAISESAADVLLEALEAASKANVTISVDLNYRAKLWKYGKSPSEIMPKLLQYCDVIFGGIDAPETMFGIVPEDKDSTKGELLETDLISIAEQMLKRFPKARLFSSTLRWIKTADHHQLQGMIFAREGGELYLASTYDMPKMLDRIGGGDAFMAGLIHGLIHFKADYQQIVNFATSASVLKHYTHGDFGMASKSDIESLIHGRENAISR